MAVVRRETRAQSGMVLSAAGSIWSSDLLLARVVRIDPATNAVVRRIPFAARPFGVASGAGSVWVADRSANVLTRIDTRTNRVAKRITIGFSSYGAAFGASSVWVTSEADGTVRRISPRTNRVTKTIKVGSGPNGVVYAFGALWVADLGEGSLVRVDVKTNRVTRKIKVAKADWITPSPDALWISSETGQVVRVDPSRGAIVARVRVGKNPLGSAWVGGELWVPTTAPCRSSTRRRTPCARRKVQVRDRSRSSRPPATPGSRTRLTGTSGGCVRFRRSPGTRAPRQS